MCVPKGAPCPLPCKISEIEIFPILDDDAEFVAS